MASSEWIFIPSPEMEDEELWGEVIFTNYLQQMETTAFGS